LKVRSIVLSAILLIMALSRCTAPASAGASDLTPLAAGIVGRLDPITCIRALSGTEDMVLAMACDSLFAWGGPEGSIEPQLAYGWPSFDAVSGKVTVMLKSGTGAGDAALFDAVSVADCLSSRIPQGSDLTVSAGPDGVSLVFGLGEDPGIFWVLFAFAPVYSIDTAGCLVGAGDPPYRLVKCEAGAYLFEPVSQGRTQVVVKGYTDTQTMLSAFSNGELHYVSTDLSRTAAAIKGTYWSSDSMAVTAVSYNPSSPLFRDAALRASVSKAIDRSYLVLRTIPGRASVASGIYFQSPQTAEASPLSKGSRIRLLVASDKAYSLEMLCAVMVKSWWERQGAQVSVITATPEAGYRSQIAAGAYDAVISTGWLQPGFRGLTTAVGEGGFLPDGLVQTNQDIAALVDSIKNPGSFDGMSSCSMRLEASLLSNCLVFPLVRPTKSELYRPDKFTGWSMQQGRPLINSFRDFSAMIPLV